MNKIERIKKLTTYLNECSNLYYNSGNSPITDREYDELLLELEALENDTNFRLGNSPTFNVGYQILDSLPKYTHPTPLLSADKTKSIDDLVKFARQGECVISIKCDGLTTNVHYANGKMIRGVTRGDGVEGQEVTHNLTHVQNLPLTIKEDSRFRVTGESVIFDDDFEAMKGKVFTSTGEPFSNSRNMASGSLTHTDSNEFAKRNVNFVAFNLESGFEELDNISDCYTKLNELGFTVVPYEIISKDITIEQMEETVNRFQSLAHSMGLPLDGVIIRYNSRSFSKSLGRTSKFYKDMIAYKFEDDWYKTTLTGVEWNTKRTGVVFPKGCFESVNVKGANLSKATLNNVSYMLNLKLHIGDTISVSRRNEVIPCIEANHTEHEEMDKSLIPTHCPSCGAELKQMEGDKTIFLYCPNKETCPAQNVSKVAFFASKGALNIEGLSESTVEKLFDLGVISSVQDLYHLELHEDEIINANGFGESSYNNLVEAINKSRHTTLDKFITGLGIAHIGKTAAKALASFYSWDFGKFYQSGISHKDDYTQIEDFGDVMHNSLREFFDKECENKVVLKLSEEFVFECPEVIAVSLDSPFLEKTFCITGSFECGKRPELQKKIEDMGGKFVSGVSKKTDILVAGDKCGSKLDKAKEFGIRIIEENELKEILGI